MSRLSELRISVAPAYFLAALLLAACGQLSVTDEIPCPVTDPNGSTPPGEQPSEYYHGNSELWTALWPNGTVVFSPSGPGEIREDGSLAMKFPWWRGSGVRGKLEIKGHRLDGESSPAHGEIPSGYGDTGFQASGIVFPSSGCWEITGRVADAQLVIIQRVVRTGG